jgi:hypothetical protein
MSYFTRSSEGVRLEMYCDILHIHWTECRSPTGREVALPISQTART